MRGLSEPLVNLRMTPIWVGVLICLRIGKLRKRILISYIYGLCPVACNKAQFQVLHLGRNNPHTENRLGEKWMENCPELGVLVDN